MEVFEALLPGLLPLLLGGAGAGAVKVIDLWLARGRLRQEQRSAEQVRLDKLTDATFARQELEIKRLGERLADADRRLGECEERAEKFLTELKWMRDRVLELERLNEWDGQERRKPRRRAEGGL